jgi:hypothetical protein
MPIVKNGYVVQAFLSYRPDPAFGIAVGLWGTKWSADYLYSNGTKHVVERPCELRVPVVDKKSKGPFHFTQLPDKLTCLLGRPESIGIRCDSSEMYSPRAYFNEEEHVKPLQSDRLHGEKVAGQYLFFVVLQEGAPGAAAALWRWQDAIALDQFAVEESPARTGRSSGEGSCGTRLQSVSSGRREQEG